jgi:hypothetical protein
MREPEEIADRERVRPKVALLVPRRANAGTRSEPIHERAGCLDSIHRSGLMQNA